MQRARGWQVSFRIGATRVDMRCSPNTAVTALVAVALIAVLLPRERSVAAAEETPPSPPPHSCAAPYLRAPYGEHPMASAATTRFAVSPDIRQISEAENVTEKRWLPCHKRPISDARERFKREGWREPPIDSLCCFPKKGCFRCAQRCKEHASKCAPMQLALWQQNSQMWLYSHRSVLDGKLELPTYTFAVDDMVRCADHRSVPGPQKFQR